MVNRIVNFAVACLVAKPLDRSEAKGGLLMIQTYVNYFDIMLTGLSQQGHIQSYSKSEAWQLSTQL